MISMRWAALGCSAAFLLATTPVSHALDLRGLTVADADSVMLNSMDATQLGIAKKRVQSLTALTSNVSAVDDIWICDLSADEEVQIPGTRSLIKSVARSLDQSKLNLAVHEFHVFPNAKVAGQAYKKIATRATACSGTHMPAPDVDMSEMPAKVLKTTTLTNGVKRTPEGNRFVWVASQTTQPDTTTGYAENSYRTFRQVGSTIQVVYVENEGEGALPLAKSITDRADKLTGDFGDRLVSRSN